MNNLCIVTYTYITWLYIQPAHNEKKKTLNVIIYKLFVYIFVTVTKI